jgi:NADH-quinone oxidoreductase subunit M
MDADLAKLIVDSTLLALALTGASLVDSKPRLSRVLRGVGFATPLLYLIFSGGNLFPFQEIFLLTSVVVAYGVSFHSEDYYRFLHGKASYPQTLIDTALALLEIAFSSINMFELFISWFLLDLVLILIILVEKGVENYRVAVTYIILSILPSDIALFTTWTLLSQRVGVYGSLLQELITFSKNPIGVNLPVSLLLLAGFTAKIAQFPLHMWLPIVQSEAPSHGSAILSSLVDNIGVLMILVAGRIMILPGVFYGSLVIQGLVSSLYAFFAASLQDDLKRLLAYSTVGHLGIVSILLGVGGLGVFDTTPLTLFYIFYHSVTKALGFLNAGLIEQVANTRKVYELGYIDAVYPEATPAGLMVTLSLTGVPPTAGFTAKALIFYIILQLVLGGSQHTIIPYWLSLFTAASLAIASVLSIAYSIKLFAAYTSSPRKIVRKVVGAGKLELFSEYYLATAIIVLALASALILPAPQIFTIVAYASLIPFLTSLSLMLRRVEEEKTWLTGVEM